MRRNPADFGWDEELADVKAELEGESVWLYHATTPAIAKRIVDSGVLRIPPGANDSYGVYGTTSADEARADNRGGAVVRFLVPLRDVEFEDYFPGLSLWAQIETRRGSYRPTKIDGVWAQNPNVQKARKIGEHLGVDWATSPFPPSQLAAGIEVELEHGTVDPRTDVTGDDVGMTAKIALAHLYELPDYYVRLAEMEED